MDSSGEELGGAAEPSRVGRPPLPRWKKVLLTAAAFLFVVGLGFKGYALLGGGGEPARHENVDRERKGSAGGSTLVPGAESSFLPQGEGAAGERSVTGAPEGVQGVDDWSPLFLKGGLGFLVGFSVGYALRFFARMSAVVIGMIFLAILGLSYAGAIEVHWDLLQKWFDTAVTAAKAQTASLQAFVQGSLPTAGLATAGLLTGFKKH